MPWRTESLSKISKKISQVSLFEVAFNLCNRFIICVIREHSGKSFDNSSHFSLNLRRQEIFHRDITCLYRVGNEA